MALRRIQEDLQELVFKPLDNCSAGPEGTNLFHWSATMNGTPGTPYENGVFLLDILIPNEYPFKPPQVIFKTKIYHPNITPNGVICIDVLRNNWRPNMNIKMLLESISTIFSKVNPEDPLVQDIANQYKNDRAAFEREAREWTQRYAT